MGDGNLAFSSLTICVALVACGLSRGLVFHHAGNAGFFGVFAGIGLCLRGGVRDCLALDGFGLGTGFFFPLCLLALEAPRFAGCGNRCTLCLALRLVRLCGYLCGAICVQERCLCIRCSGAAVRKLVVSGVLQVVFLLWSYGLVTLQSQSCEKRWCCRRAFIAFLGEDPRLDGAEGDLCFPS